MVGIIWFVQLVHYPLFRLVGELEHPRHHTAHMARTGLLLAPLMLLELVSGLVLLSFVILNTNTNMNMHTDSDWLVLPQTPSITWILISLILLVVIWLWTFLVSVRYHRQLDHGKNPVAIAALIRTNWLRTILWSVRLLLLGLAVV